ncbi:uncharacterized protein B0H64DRAFT_450599 [Chaetomium fimeti]|uniref:Uncharacterized protein n=1 Tax=Chaetomium fimeti TaxID=1854472 RepID=A0AAE0H795_9PEZI|nr:hypothetical protein B0H64DRAFT_450599 [Chaetomium fimeti]
MAPAQSSQDMVYGWVSSPNVRGTRDILISSLKHIRFRRHRWLLNKFRWQLFAIFFPEVLVATAAEQWLSARQSTRTFARLGYPQWTIRHAFFADMGGIVVAPPDAAPFPVDSQQIAYLVERKYLELPDLSTEDIRSMNKADGLARLVTMAQMAWYCLSCTARGASGLGFCTLEATTLAYILCTTHTFFFWYYKPLDPEAQRVFTMRTSIFDICGGSAKAVPDLMPTYTHTPLDFIKPPPDPKSLIAPFWFGLSAVLRPSGGREMKKAKTEPRVQTLANSRLLFFGLHIGFAWVSSFPSDTEWFLWMGSTAVDFGLIAIYLLAIPVGTYLTPWLGRVLFGVEATHFLEVASALPPWAKPLVHAPFVLGYIVARVAVLVESVLSLRALPESVYQDVNWTSFLPHV